MFFGLSTRPLLICIRFTNKAFSYKKPIDILNSLIIKSAHLLRYAIFLLGFGNFFLCPEIGFFRCFLKNLGVS